MSKHVPFYALLIGINDYKVGPRGDMPALVGAVNDAKDFKTYIETMLGVPDDHITLLTNNSATRSAIISSFEKLENDERIQPGDPIFIYYAGHGAQIKAPENWECTGADGTIQAIVPYDCDTFIGSEIVAPIPDRTLNALLSAIARKKDNNITVVFDCCHSASGTRSAGAGIIASDELEVTARSIELNREYPPTLDQHIWDVSTPRSLHTSSKFARYGIESHVLLAACGAEQRAYESRPVGTQGTGRRGRFSTALLKLLFSEPPNNLQYCDIVNRLGHIEDQVPHCEGYYKERFLFNSKVLPSQRECFGVHYVESTEHNLPGHYVVDAGTLHKITLQSEFRLFMKSDVNRFQSVDPSQSVGTLSIRELKPFSSVADVSFKRAGLERSEIVAILAKSGRKNDLQLFIPPKDGFLDIYRKLEKKDALVSITLAKESSNANIEIQTGTHNNQALVKLNPPYHPCLKSYSDQFSGHPMTQTISKEPSELATLLSKAAKFYRELKIVETGYKFSEFIKVYFYELKDDYISEEPYNLSPVKPSVNLFKDGQISITHGPNVPYGLKLVNTSRVNLYLNLFYLNNRELSIYPWVESCRPTTLELPDAPLRAKGSLAIGWGDAGHTPKCCELGNGIDFRVDYLKIYLTNEPVNLSYLCQSSPFSSDTARSFKNYTPPRASIWLNEIIPIVQCRHKPRN